MRRLRGRAQAADGSQQAGWFYTSSEIKKLTQDSTPRIDIHLMITNKAPRDVTVQLIQT